MPKRTNDGLKKRCAHSRKHWADCACAWWFSFFSHGKRHRYSLTKLAELRGAKAPRSKDDAIVWRDNLRAEIRSGTFIDPDAPKPVMPADVRLTFGDVCDKYLEGHVRTPGRRVRGQYEMAMLIRMMRRAEVVTGSVGVPVKLEDKPIDVITKADVEAVRTWRRRVQAEKCGTSKEPQSSKGGEVGINRLLSRMRHVFVWAIGEGYCETTPFRRGPVAVVKLNSRAEGPRTRRLEPGELDGLLKNANPHLRSLIVAALSTGCRIGELLSLQWSQVRFEETRSSQNGGNVELEPRWLVLPSDKTKTNEARVLPIGPKLRAELSMRRHAPDGNEHPTTGYVFGDETGARVKSVDAAWELTVLRSHGHTPVWTASGPRRLAAESRGTLRAINLRMHDLRREFACSLLESSADLHDVRDFLGHANITTTSRYLSTSPMRLARALARLEGETGRIDTSLAQSGVQDEHSTSEADAEVIDSSVS